VAAVTGRLAAALAAALLAAVLAAALAGCGAAQPPDRAGAERPPAAPPAVLAVRVPTDVPSGEHATALAIGGGRALTVAHVLHAGRPVLVDRRRARVVRVDRRLDLSVLAVPGLRAPSPARGAARAGERVSVRVLRGGAVKALPATVRRIVTARLSGNGPVQVRPAIELAAAVMPGDSGAPIVAPDGRVIGIVFAQASDRDLAYALDARALGSLLTA
jgi:S1-C subfamily serine protease